MLENLCNKISIKVNPNSYWHYFTSVLSVVAQLTAAWTLGRGPLSRPRIQRGLAPACSQSTNPTISATCCLGLSPTLSLPPTRHAWSLASDLASQASDIIPCLMPVSFSYYLWAVVLKFNMRRAATDRLLTWVMPLMIPNGTLPYSSSRMSSSKKLILCTLLWNIIDTYTYGYILLWFSKNRPV